MKKAILIPIVLMFIVFSAHAEVNVSSNIFEKGIIYYALNDDFLAKRYLNEYFKSYRDTIIKRGFQLLLRGDYRKADTLFKNYLSIRKYSVMAMIGAALARNKINETDTVEYLKIAKRLKPRYSLSHGCLALKYIEQKKYGLAKSSIISALRWSKVPDYKLVQAKLYLSLQDYNTAYNMLTALKNQLDNNFYLRYYLARSAFALNKIDQVKENISEAIRLKPDFLDAKVILAQYYIKVNNLRKANMILRDIKNKKTNFAYLKTYAQLLLRLKDRRCKEFLLKAFDERKWDMDINRLLGEYYLWQKQDKMVQNFINRAILSGNDTDKLKEIFSIKYRYPEYPYLNFFDVIHIRWLDEETLAAVIKNDNTDNDYLSIINVENKKVIATFRLTGRFKKLFANQSGDNLIVSLLNYSRNHLYAIMKRKNRYQIRQLNTSPLKIESVIVQFDEQQNTAFITDSQIQKSVFESPFTVKLELGDKKPYYPLYPFRIYRYDFDHLRFQRIKKYVNIEEVNIPCVRKYYAVVEAYNFNSDIKSLIQRGEKLEIDSTDEIKIFFPRHPGSFMIYSSDLDNPFMAKIYHNSDSSIINVDSIMLLGKNKYISMQVVDFWPEKNEILFLINDEKDNSLITFNYKTNISYRIANRYLSSKYNSDQKEMYVIKKRSHVGLFPETEVIVLDLDEFYKDVYSIDKNIGQIVFFKDYQIYFNTFHGGFVKIDLLNKEKKYQYLRPSLEGSVHDRLEGSTRSAAFINGRLFFMD